uniref:Uncharacterized protein n=1 Tax=Meloidogyne javanica TaxID=6303 RepID=A0A915M888_MELJA
MNNKARAMGIVACAASTANRSDTVQKIVQLAGRQLGMVEQVEEAGYAFVVFAMVMLLLHAAGDIEIATTMRMHAITVVGCTQDLVNERGQMKLHTAHLCIAMELYRGNALRSGFEKWHHHIRNQHQ